MMRFRFAVGSACLAALLSVRPLRAVVSQGEIHEADQRPHAPGRILVRVREGKCVPAARGVGNAAALFPSSAAPSAGESDSCRVARERLARWRRVTLEEGIDARAYLAEVESWKNTDPACPIESAELDRIVRAADVPDDPAFALQYALHNTGQGGGRVDADVDAPEAWDIETGSPDVMIAVIDTGVDWTHPDLKDKIWQNLAEDADADGHVIEYVEGEWRLDPGDLDAADNDGNGFVDDLVGWDFLNRDNDPRDDHSHGTHCAGIAAAATGNAAGIAGAARGCTVVPVKFLDATGTGSSSDGACGIVYAADMGARVLSNSWGGEQSGVVEDALEYAFQRGALAVFAAGNNGSDRRFYPAAFPRAMAVASTDRSDMRSSFSNFGFWIDLAAPGSDIYSTLPGGQYGEQSGTSMAAPLVAGVAALLFSQNRGRTPGEVWGRLVGGADDIDALNPGYGLRLGGGRLNALRALTETPAVRILYRGDTHDDPLGNGDHHIDRGETISGTVSIENVWAPASNVAVAIHSADPYVSAVECQGNVGAMGAPSTADIPFRFTVGPATPWGHELALTLVVTEGGEPRLSRELAYRLEYPYCAGFPLTGGRFGQMHPWYPKVADLDGNGSREIIVHTWFDDVYVFNADGSTADGWPVRCYEPGLTNEYGAYSVPAIADLDGDGDMEIVVGSMDGRVYALHHDGSSLAGFPVQLGSPPQLNQCPPAVADLDGDGDFEIVMMNGPMNGRSPYTLYALHHTGDIVSGWPQNTGVSLRRAAPVAGDFDGDGACEVVAYGTRSDGAFSACLLAHDGTAKNGWPRTVADPVFNPTYPIVAGDADGDSLLELIAMPSDIVVWNHDGSVSAAQQPYTNGYAGCTGLVLGRLGIGAPPTAFYGTYNYPLYGASYVCGWSMEDIRQQAHAPSYRAAVLTDRSMKTDPLVADVDGDGGMDVLSVVWGGDLMAWDSSGAVIPGFPLSLGRYGQGGDAPLIADLDGDGLIELLTIYDRDPNTDFGLIAFDLPCPYTPGAIECGEYRYDPRNTGVRAGPAAPERTPTASPTPTPSPPASTPTPTPTATPWGPPYRINFQPSGFAPPDGYSTDSGEPYGGRWPDWGWLASLAAPGDGSTASPA